MILSNSAIVEAIKAGLIIIDPLPEIPSFEKPDSPFESTALNLRLSNTLSIPKKGPYVFNLRKGNLAPFLRDNSEQHPIDPQGGFALEPQKFVLSTTKEKIKLPIKPNKPCYAARVEGRSSFARCGLMVHLTAPTIHAGFEGVIALELINFGINPIMLYPDINICQIVFEQVEGDIKSFTPSQFQGQSTAEGL